MMLKVEPENSCVFTVQAMLQYTFVRSDFCSGMIISLLKDKHGDATVMS